MGSDMEQQQELQRRRPCSLPAAHLCLNGQRPLKAVLAQHLQYLDVDATLRPRLDRPGDVCATHLSNQAGRRAGKQADRQAGHRSDMYMCRQKNSCMPATVQEDAVDVGLPGYLAVLCCSP